MSKNDFLYKLVKQKFSVEEIYDIAHQEGSPYYTDNGWAQPALSYYADNHQTVWDLAFKTFKRYGMSFAGWVTEMNPINSADQFDLVMLSAAVEQVCYEIYKEAS